MTDYEEEAEGLLRMLAPAVETHIRLRFIEENKDYTMRLLRRVAEEAQEFRCPVPSQCVDGPKPHFHSDSAELSEAQQRDAYARGLDAEAQAHRQREAALTSRAEKAESELSAAREQVRRLHALLAQTLESWVNGRKVADGMMLTLRKRCDAALAETAQPHAYDKSFGDDRKCQCGHIYYRHFDTYDEMAAVGCKYCDCHTFKLVAETAQEKEK